jgi:hypothetical protein
VSAASAAVSRVHTKLSHLRPPVPELMRASWLMLLMLLLLPGAMRQRTALPLSRHARSQRVRAVLGGRASSSCVRHSGSGVTPVCSTHPLARADTKKGEPLAPCLPDKSDFKAGACSPDAKAKAKGADGKDIPLNAEVKCFASEKLTCQVFRNATGHATVLAQCKAAAAKKGSAAMAGWRGLALLGLLLVSVVALCVRRARRAVTRQPCSGAAKAAGAPPDMPCWTHSNPRACLPAVWWRAGCWLCRGDGVAGVGPEGVGTRARAMRGAAGSRSVCTRAERGVGRGFLAGALGRHALCHAVAAPVCCLPCSCTACGPAHPPSGSSANACLVLALWPNLVDLSGWACPAGNRPP